MGSDTETQTPVETVDYSQEALDQVETIISRVDFSVFMSMFVLVIGATAAVTVGITALRKGWGWVKSAIKRAGN